MKGRTFTKRSLVLYVMVIVVMLLLHPLAKKMNPGELKLWSRKDWRDISDEMNKQLKSLREGGAWIG